ncbi:glycosyltransferase family 1 protein [Plantactinospora mayteni]|uniref:GDP-mannose-dependent alpha-(1-6)-phosphatidylinositol dimannoside mannosyltransferase n=1 Tax=Plantactinospora mayteni TaxID=566021 RepID=A0ABQ4ESF6_9ACTN|nr:glycosyltransferase [Plantactinospora mayteni]GIG97603.1 GDP-mannose-dependent alpha-(1-6)-phosphatidylinositol dimannoside mannosyltransferase [Plantactinospora mayteni]
MRIVRLANFITESSGGLRTALRQLGAGYAAAGHEPVLVMPGRRDTDEQTEQGRVITLASPSVPGMGGYRVVVDRFRLARLLRELRPDRLEISDRTTLRWTGAWARRHGVRSMMVSHESLDGLLRLLPGGQLRRVADRLNLRTVAGHDQIVCTTSWAAAEFRRIGAGNLCQVPLGVDLDHFRPDRYDPRLRAVYAESDELLLLHCGRLSPEKRPERSLAALAELRARGVPAVLVVVGDGPRRERLRATAARDDLPVRFLRYVADRDLLARLLATADMVLAPGPVETFGLAALEALASGTPVVASAESALPEVLGPAGLAAPGEGPGYADAVLELAVRPGPERRAAARRQAERFPWSAAVAGFLAAHDLPVRAQPSEVPATSGGR